MNERALGSRAIAIISYITWIGWIIALVIRDRRDVFVTHHLNQALVINIIRFAAELALILPVFGRTLSWIIGIAALAFWILGLYRAYKYSAEPLPIIGQIKILD